MDDDIIDDLGNLIDPLDIADLNGDGEHDLIELQITEDILFDEVDEDLEQEDDDCWWLYFDGDNDYGINPEDYESKADYLEALEEAKSDYENEDDGEDDYWCDEDDDDI